MAFRVLDLTISILPNDDAQYRGVLLCEPITYVPKPKPGPKPKPWPKPPRPARVCAALSSHRAPEQATGCEISGSTAMLAELEVLREELRRVITAEDLHR